MDASTCDRGVALYGRAVIRSSSIFGISGNAASSLIGIGSIKVGSKVNLTKTNESCQWEQLLAEWRTNLPNQLTVDATLAKWLKMVALGDFRDLPSIIATEAVYHSPVEWHPHPGRDLVCPLVRTAAGVFENFKYQRQFVGGADAALEFSAHVGDIEMKGVHMALLVTARAE